VNRLIHSSHLILTKLFYNTRTINKKLGHSIKPLIMTILVMFFFANLTPSNPHTFCYNFSFYVNLIYHVALRVSSLSDLVSISQIPLWCPNWYNKFMKWWIWRQQRRIKVKILTPCLTNFSLGRSEDMTGWRDVPRTSFLIWCNARQGGNYHVLIFSSLITT